MPMLILQRRSAPSAPQRLLWGGINASAVAPCVSVPWSKHICGAFLAICGHFRETRYLNNFMFHTSIETTARIGSLTAWYGYVKIDRFIYSPSESCIAFIWYTFFPSGLFGQNVFLCTFLTIAISAANGWCRSRKWKQKYCIIGSECHDSNGLSLLIWFNSTKPLLPLVTYYV